MLRAKKMKILEHIMIEENGRITKRADQSINFIRIKQKNICALGNPRLMDDKEEKDLTFEKQLKKYAPKCANAYCYTSYHGKGSTVVQYYKIKK